MSEPLISQSELWQDRRRRTLAFVRRGVPFVSGVLAAFIALLLYTILNPPPRQMTQKDVDTSVAQALASATAPLPYSAVVFQVIQPYLVLIQSHVMKTNRLAADDGTGTGVIVND